MRFPAAHFAPPDGAPSSKKSWSIASSNKVTPSELDAVLTCTGRQVALRFRSRPGESVFAEVVRPLRQHLCTVAPWGCAGALFTFDARELRSVLVAIVGRYEEHAAICAEQRRMAAEGRFA